MREERVTGQSCGAQSSMASLLAPESKCLGYPGSRVDSCVWGAEIDVVDPADLLSTARDNHTFGETNRCPRGENDQNGIAGGGLFKYA